jgi:hypothetical protein
MGLQGRNQSPFLNRGLEKRSYPVGALTDLQGRQKGIPVIPGHGFRGRMTETTNNPAFPT